MANSVKIRIDGDTKGFEKALGSIEGATKKTISAVVKGTGIIAAGFGAATVASLNFAGELEQNMGGSEAVFKEYASEIQGAAEAAFKNMGLSASDYLATANKMGALFKGAGFEMAEAADITQKAMQRAADVASIMGIDVSMAMESIAGAAKGNFTMMDNLGVAMNETTLNAYALEIGLGKTTAQMTNQEKVALAMEMFLDRTAYATGNYAKENDTLAGSLSTAKAALENFMSGAGTVDEVVKSLTNAGDVILGNLTALVPRLAEGAGELVKGLIPSLIEMIVENAPQLIEAGLEVISAFIQAIEDNSSEIARAALLIGQTLIEGIIKIIPQLAEVAGQIIAQFAKELGNTYPLLKPLANAIEFLANNIKSLTVGIIAVVAAFKMIAILQSVITWFKATKAATAAYGTALNAMRTNYVLTNTQMATLNKGLSASQLIFGVLTGSVKLTSAQFKQLAVDVALSTAGISILIGLVAVGASKMSEMADSTSEPTEETKSLTEEINELNKSYDEEIKAIDATKNEELAKIKVVEKLKDELYALENQFKSNTLSEEEEKEVQKQFNGVANELNSIIPGIVNNLYDETGAINIQKGAVDELTDSYIEMAKAKAMATAYESKMNAAAKKIVDAEEKLEETQEKWNKMHSSSEIRPKYNYKTGEQEGYITVYHKEGGGFWESEDFVEAKTALTTAETTLENATKELDTYVGKYNESMAEIATLTKDETKELGETAEGTATGVTNTVNKETEKQKTAIEQAVEYELYTLERANKLGIITEKEYYDGLQKIRDKYFAEGSEDWQEYTEDIEDYYDSVFKDIKAKVDKLADNFIDKTNKTYATITLDADGEIQTWHMLSDMDSQNKQLKYYLSLLEQLKEKRGEIPKDAVSELSGMDTKEAVTFLETMLNASDEQWNNWVSGIEENKALAKELSKEIYADEIEANQEIIQKLVDEWGEVPDNFFKIGEACGDEYGDGFKEALNKVGGQLKDAAMGLFSTFSASLSLQPANSAANGQSTVNNYTDNRITNITAASSSPHAIAEAQKQAGIYQEHTGKFGG